LVENKAAKEKGEEEERIFAAHGKEIHFYWIGKSAYWRSNRIVVKTNKKRR
jgi:hypothetical protein